MAGHLSERLTCACSLVTDGLVLADIGTDHAFLPIERCRSGRTPSAIAADVRPGPLSRAEAHVREAQMEDRIECRLSDGFSAIRPGEVQTAVITGMGGLLICDILRRGAETVDSLQELILGPQSEPADVRRCAAEMGFAIDREEMIEEDGKFYVLIRLRRDRHDGLLTSGKNSDADSACTCATDWKDTGFDRDSGLTGKTVQTCQNSVNIDETPDEEETERLAALNFGPYLLAHRNPVLYRFLCRRQEVLAGLLESLSKKRAEGGLSPAAEKRYSEIKEEMRLIATAQKRYEK